MYSSSSEDEPDIKESKETNFYFSSSTEEETDESSNLNENEKMVEKSLFVCLRKCSNFGVLEYSSNHEK